MPPGFKSTCELLGLDMSEELAGLDGSAMDGESLLSIAPPPAKMPRLAEPAYLQDVGLLLATKPPGLLDFQRRPSKKAIGFANSAVFLVWACSHTTQRGNVRRGPSHRPTYTHGVRRPTSQKGVVEVLAIEGSCHEGDGEGTAS